MNFPGVHLESGVPTIKYRYGSIDTMSEKSGEETSGGSTCVS
jgi:hypothetical protein